MTKIKPLQDRVVIKRLPEETLSGGGIVIPDSAKEKPAQGTVIAVGPGKALEDGKTAPMSLKVNDTVLFGKYSGTEVTLSGEEFIVMREDDILGTIA